MTSNADLFKLASSKPFTLGKFNFRPTDDKYTFFIGCARGTTCLSCEYLNSRRCNRPAQISASQLHYLQSKYPEYFI